MTEHKYSEKIANQADKDHQQHTVYVDFACLVQEIT